MKGYVRKRGSTWSFTIDVGKDAITGKRKQKTKGGFKTKKEATAAMNETIYEINKGTWIEPQNILIKDFSVEWIRNYRHKLRETTAEQYESKVTNWINPILGDLKVQEIKAAHAQMFAGQLLEKMRTSTAHKVYSIAKLMMNHAVELDLISVNPFKKVTAIKTTKRKMETWTFDELNHFLTIAKKTHDLYYRMFAVTAFTGLRKGEMLGLRKEDVDFEKGKLSIRQSLAETKEGVQVSALKTPSSYRQIAIDPFLVSILKEQIHKNNELKMKLGSEYQDHGLIFCHPDGIPYRPTSLNRPFKRIVERAGVPKIRFHDMRHTHATLLLELNVNPKIVADRLGHASIKETLDTYSHASLALQSDVATLFSDQVKNGKRGQNVVNP